MTDRIKGVWVAFDRDLHEKDAKATMNAIRQIKGVIAVEANIANFDDWMARQRIRSEFAVEIAEFLDKLFNKG